MDYVPSVIVLIFVIFITSFACSIRQDMSHAHLGSKGGPCFPNGTCRENLRCIEFDGMKATCVKIGTMKLPSISLN
jgi:hypothetical protein